MPHAGHEGRSHFGVPLCLVVAFSIFDPLSWSCVTSQHRVQFFHDQINTVILHQRVVHDDLSCSPALAFELSQKKKSTHVGSSSTMTSPAKRQRSRFHWWQVYAGVGAEKLGGGSCPSRGPTTVSSSTLSHCLAMVSSHARAPLPTVDLPSQNLAQTRQCRDTVTWFYQHTPNKDLSRLQRSE